ncbi:MAG: hypothetical protein PF961_12790 [Planctomycetota bacterium]|jgi:hypothetical protein|nr:hypothetical protein [Planctomycetota bacterium]
MQAGDSYRSGVVLVVVAGIAALLVSLAVVFLSMMRRGGDDVAQVQRSMQARMMLYAACNYVQETARLGWGSESFGWVDVRGEQLPGGLAGGSRVGPRAVSTAADPFGASLQPARSTGGSAQAFPREGGIARCDIYVMEKPKHAVSARTRYNPMPTADAELSDLGVLSGGSYTSDWRSWARFPNPEPWPAGLDQSMVNAGASASFMAHADGTWDPGAVAPSASIAAGFAAEDARPRSGTEGLAWFRVFREPEQFRDGDGMWRDDGDRDYDDPGDGGASRPLFYDTVDMSKVPATFIVTCGAGASRGWRSWAEIEALPVAQRDAVAGLFMHSEDYFDQVRREESLLWFRIEWSPQVNGGAASVYTQDTDAASGMNQYYTTTGKLDELGYIATVNPVVIPQPPALPWNGNGSHPRYGKHIGMNFRAEGSGDYNSDWGFPPGGNDRYRWVQSIDYTRLVVRNAMGTIKWVQRLDREPPVW